MERDRWFRTLLVLLVFIAAMYLFEQLWLLAGMFSDIILLFFMAWLLAFVLHPLADRIQQLTHSPFGVSVAIVYVSLAIVLFLAGLLVVPAMVGQASLLSRDLPTYLDQVPGFMQSLQSELTARGFNVDLTAAYSTENIMRQVETWGTTVLQNTVTIAASVATVLFDTLIVLMLSFYMMLDGPAMVRRLLRLVPGQYSDEIGFLEESIDRTFGGFMRGQLIQAVIYGVATALVMRFAGLGFIGFVSIGAGVLMTIPLVGPYMALLPPVLIAVFQQPGNAWWVFLALVIIQFLLANVLVPRLMSESVGIPPLLVFFSLFMGAKVAGFWGALFGIPVMGVLYAMASYIYHNLEKRQSTGTAPRGRGPNIKINPEYPPSAAPTAPQVDDGTVAQP